MRIAVNDVDDELFDAEYVEAEEDYTPGAVEEVSESAPDSDEPQEASGPDAEAPIEEDLEQNRVNPLVDNTQHMSLGLSLNFRKFLAIAGMFIVMFVIPVGVFEGWFNPENFSPKQVYTADTLASEGRVAGISVSNTQASVQTNTNQFLDREVFGLSMGLVFIILGFVFIAIPTILLLR